MIADKAQDKMRELLKTNVMKIQPMQIEKDAIKRDDRLGKKNIPLNY